MRLRNRPWAAGELAACSYYVREPGRFHGKWASAFPRRAPIWLELGCGKGLWLAGMAPRHPELNFIGADIKGLMLAYARREIECAFKAAGKTPDNVMLLSVDVSRIDTSFGEDDRVERIYINFCNPWPKQRDKKHRLVHTKQLLKYRAFLADGGCILFKTDDDDLFADAHAYFSEAGYTVAESLSDLYATCAPDPTLLTEHERKFLDAGKPIHFIRAVK